MTAGEPTACARCGERPRYEPPSGRRNLCRECHNAATREWGRANRDRTREYGRSWARRNPEHARRLRMSGPRRRAMEHARRRAQAGSGFCSNCDEPARRRVWVRSGSWRGAMCGACERWARERGMELVLLDGSDLSLAGLP